MTYQHAFVKWLGSAGLLLAMTGCPTGDDGDTAVTSFNPQPTTSVGATGESSTGEASTGTPATTMPAESSSSSDSADTSGGVTCDPPCEAGQECIGGTCFDMGGEESSSGDPPPPTNSDYGPCNACAAGESPIMIGMIPGCICSPMCDGQGSMCPAPNTGTAVPMCVLELMMGAGPTQCALICTDDADCPTGATCEDAGGGSVCMHPA